MLQLGMIKFSKYYISKQHEYFFYCTPFPLRILSGFLSFVMFFVSIFPAGTVIAVPIVDISPEVSFPEIINRDEVPSVFSVASVREIYNSLGQLSAYIDFKGQKTEYVYDNLGRIKYKHYYPANSNTYTETIEYIYDTLGRVSQVIDSRGTTVYTYNSHDSVTAISSPEGEIHYEYDEITDLLTRTYTANTDTAYTYDILGRISKVTANKRCGMTVSGTTSYEYTKLGMLSSVTRPDGTKESYEYDDLNRLIKLTQNNTNNELLAEYVYNIRSDGLRTKVTERIRNSDNTVNPKYIPYLQ